jgi:tryptophanase
VQAAQDSLYFDACRFAENSYFIKLREKGFESKSPSRLHKRCSVMATAAPCRRKRTAMANIGGFLCTNDDLLAQQEKDLLILTEGYPTYGAWPEGT